MRYTYQHTIAGCAQPGGREVFHADSLKEIKKHTIALHRQAEDWGCAYEPTRALIWIGELDDVTDIYPDFSAITGPRGGVQITRC